VFPNPDAAKKAEEVAAKAHAEINTKAMPARQYLDHTVVPLLMKGMQQLVREKPDDPVAYLAAYLLKHNPKHSEPAKTVAGPAEQA
jgi:protein dpy-30